MSIRQIIETIHWEVVSKESRVLILFSLGHLGHMFCACHMCKREHNQKTNDFSKTPPFPKSAFLPEFFLQPLHFASKLRQDRACNFGQYGVNIFIVFFTHNRVYNPEYGYRGLNVFGQEI